MEIKKILKKKRRGYFYLALLSFTSCSLFVSTPSSSSILVKNNKTGCKNTEMYRPLSRDVTHDELRIWPPCWRESKKEQKKFLKKYVNNIEYNR